jgi:diguanylate cyclase
MTDSQAHPKRQSLVRRLTWVSTLALGLVLATAGLALAFLVMYQARDLQLRTADQASLLLSDNVAPTLAFEQREAAEQALKGFRGRIDLQALVVWRPDGEVFVRHEFNGAPPIQWQGAQAVERYDTQGLLRVRPMHVGGELVGWLGWYESFTTLRDVLVKLLLSGLVIMVVSLASAAVLLRFVQRRALRPLVNLARVAEAVAATQDYSLRATWVRRDEVGRLAQRFNDLLHRVELWHADLNSQLKHEQQSGLALRQLAHADALTGLRNRLSFELEMERQLVERSNSGAQVALLFIDLDNFKKVNDSLGHAAGDEVLIEVTARMSRVLRSSDTLFRLGGDEFALLVTSVQDPPQVEQLAERIIAAVRERMEIRGVVVPVGATVGLAYSPDHGLDAPTLLHAADEAMYAAKRAGKNTYRVAPDLPGAQAG